MAKTKICEIDSQNLVNGTALMEYNSNLAYWESALPKLEDGTQMFDACTNLKHFNTEAGGDANYPALKNTFQMFSHSGLEYIIMYTPVLEEAYKMFEACSSLQTADIRNYDWNSGVKRNSLINTSYMFYKCKNLTDVYLSAGGEKLHNTSYMFYNCYNLPKVTCGELFDYSYNTNGMFMNCYKLQYVDSYFEETKNMDYMFCGCKKFEGIQRRGAEVDCPVTTAAYAFTNCYMLPYAKLWTPKLTNATGMFKNSTIEYCYMYDGVGTDCNCAYMFSYCDNLTDFAGDLSTVKNCDRMFFKNKILNSLYDADNIIDNLSLANCMTAQYMFAYCYDLCNFDTRMNSRLPLGNEGANGNVITITISPKLKYCTGMFYKHGLPLNTIVFLSSEVPEITNCDSMFEECYKLQSIVGLSAESIKTANKMFMSCHDITSNGVCFEDSEFLNLTKGDYMFHQCGRELGF